MKRLIAVILIFASVFLLGCTAEKPKPDHVESMTEQQADIEAATAAAPNETEAIEIIEETSGDACLVEGWTLEKSIDAAPVIFEGVCLSKERYEPQGLPDMYFRVDKVYRGDINAGDEINVMAIDFGAYGVGSSYILMTIPQASVFSGKELYYQADTTIGLINGLCDCILPDVDGTERVETEERIEAYIAGHPYTGDTAVLYEYCTSDDLMEIAEYSDQVALVSADGIFVNEGDRTVYNCTVETCFKGQASGKIRVVAFKNGMEIGEKYLVLVSNASSDQPLYIMSSQRSLLRADSPEATELMDKLK